MQVEQGSVGDQLVIRVLEPKATMAVGAQEFHSELKGTVRSRRGEATLVDLSAVEIIDSFMIYALISARKNAAEVGGSFALVGVNPRVRQILEETRLDHVFDIFETADEAAGS